LNLISYQVFLVTRGNNPFVRVMPTSTTTLLAAAIVPRTGKIIKNGHVFERIDILLQNGILYFVLLS